MTFGKKEIAIALAVFIVLNLVGFPVQYFPNCPTSQNCGLVTQLVPVTELMNPVGFFATASKGPNYVFEIGYLIVALGIAFVSTKIKVKVKK